MAFYGYILVMRLPSLKMGTVPLLGDSRILSFEVRDGSDPFILSIDSGN